MNKEIFKRTVAVLLLLGVILSFAVIGPEPALAEPYLGEIQIFPYNFAPRGWAFCDGQLLPINQNQALFSLLGTTYGGDGHTTFALPDLRGRVPIHVGSGHPLGSKGGAENVSLTANEMPLHYHLKASNAPGNTDTPAQNIFPAKAQTLDRRDVNIYTNESGILPITVTTGGSLPHNNMQPYLVVNYCIAIQGIFPSRN